MNLNDMFLYYQLSELKSFYEGELKKTQEKIAEIKNFEHDMKMYYLIELDKVYKEYGVTGCDINSIDDYELVCNITDKLFDLKLSIEPGFDNYAKPIYEHYDMWKHKQNQMREERLKQYKKQREEFKRKAAELEQIIEQRKLEEANKKKKQPGKNKQKRNKKLGGKMKNWNRN